MPHELSPVRVLFPVANDHYAAILDTGATYSIISEDLAQEWISHGVASLSNKPLCETLSTVNNSKIYPSGTLTVKTTINKEEITFQLLVIKNQHNYFLLGLNFMREFSICVDIGE